MKRVWLLFALLTSSLAYGQQVLITGAGGTTGGAITTANLGTSTFGCGTGTYSTNSAAPAFTYGTANQVPSLPTPVSICGAAYTGSPNKPFVWATNNTAVKFVYHAPATTPISFWMYYCADFYAMGNSSQSMSGPNIANGKGAT